MPKHRMCKSGGWHFVSGRVAALSARVPSSSRLSIRPLAAQAQSGAIREIQRRGQPARRAGDGPHLPAVQRRRRLRPRQGRPVHQGAVRHRPLRRRPHRPRRQRRASSRWSRTRSSTRSPSRATARSTRRRSTAEVQLKPRSVFTRAKVQADVQRILDVYRRQGRFAASVEPKIIELDRTASTSSSRSTKAAPPRSRASISSATTPSPIRSCATSSRRPSGPVRLHQGHRHLRPRPADARPRAAAPVLPQERLRRCAHRVGGRRLDRDGSGFFITFVVEEGEVYNFGDVDIEFGAARRRSQAPARRTADRPGATYDQSASTTRSRS